MAIILIIIVVILVLALILIEAAHKVNVVPYPKVIETIDPKHVVKAIKNSGRQDIKATRHNYAYSFNTPVYHGKLFSEYVPRYLEAQDYVDRELQEFIEDSNRYAVDVYEALTTGDPYNTYESTGEDNGMLR